jgi:hypothetical protein
MPHRKIARQDWFQAAYAAFGTRWQRKDSEHIIGFLSGYNPYEGQRAETILMEHAGLIMSVEYDKISGNTFYTIREPKGLQK